MTRFVRIYHDSRDDPGSRIRVDYDPDDTGAFIVADENVLPEHTQNPDARRVQAIGGIELDSGSARWLRDTLIALCNHLDAEGGEDSVLLDANRPIAIGPGDTAIIDRALGYWSSDYNDAPHDDIARIRALLSSPVGGS